MLKFRDILAGRTNKRGPSDKGILVAPKKGRKFSRRFMKSARYLQQTFDEVSPSSLEKWLDDFSCDQDPENEMKVWLHIAGTYEKAVSRFPDDTNVRKGIFQVLLQISTAMTPNEIVQDINFPRFRLKPDDVVWLYLMYMRKS